MMLLIQANFMLKSELKYVLLFSFIYRIQLDYQQNRQINMNMDMENWLSKILNQIHTV